MSIRCEPKQLFGATGLNASRLQIHRAFPNIGVLFLQFRETIQFCLQARFEQKPLRT